MTLKEFLKERKTTLGLKILLWAFAILFLIDMGVTIAQPTTMKYLESNPLYLLSGTILTVIFMNMLVFCAIWLFYPRIKPYGRFLFCNYIVWMSVFRVYAIKGNIKLLLNPPTIQYMQSVTTATKMTHYTSQSMTFFMPLVMTFIVYLIFVIDHKIQWRKSPDSSEQ